MTPGPNPTSAVNPSAESLEALAAWPDDDSIAMVNLLRFAGDAGREAYGRYAQIAATTIAARGGGLIYLAPVVAPVGSWDSLAVVRYPRRAAYLDMQNDQAYRAAVPDRTAGLSARLLYPFAYPHNNGAERVQPPATHQFVALHLLAGAPLDEPRRGEELLRLGSGGPGLVADCTFDEMRLIAYESQEAWRSDIVASSALSVLTRLELAT